MTSIKQFLTRHHRTLRRFSMICFTTSLFILAVGCTSAWTTQASAIVTLLIPAITSLLGIVSAFGYGLTPKVITEINEYASKAQAALTEVKTLIDEYNQTPTNAQAGVLAQIETLLGQVSQDMSSILPLLNITDINTQKRVQAVMAGIIAEVQALTAVIPVLKGTVTDHAQAKPLIAAVHSPKEFMHAFNEQAGSFGDQHKIAMPTQEPVQAQAPAVPPAAPPSAPPAQS